MRDRIDQLTTSLQNHLADQNLTSHKPFAALSLFEGSIAQWAYDRLKQSIEEKLDTPEERQAIGEAALRVFDAWDIPYIEGLVESAVKSMVKPKLIWAIDQILSGAVTLL